MPMPRLNGDVQLDAIAAALPSPSRSGPARTAAVLPVSFITGCHERGLSAAYAGAAPLAVPDVPSPLWLSGDWNSIAWFVYWVILLVPAGVPPEKLPRNGG